MEPLDKWHARVYLEKIWNRPTSRNELKKLVLACMRTDPKFRHAMQVFIASSGTEERLEEA